MTIGIGFSASDGCGLLTDSMMEFEHAGGFTPMPGLRSPHWLPSLKTVLVVSGNLMSPEGKPRDLDGLCATIKERSVDAALAHLFAELEADEQRSRRAS